MVQLVLSDEQVEILRRAGGTVVVVDRSGRDLGSLVPSETTDPDVALALQRMRNANAGGRFYSTAEVLDHLQAAE